MRKIEETYPIAVEHTKQKLMKDIDSYFERQEFLPSFEQYVSEREEFIGQIWINVWINRASNDVPKKEKKQYLKNLGYETEGVDKKIINKLFRNEMKSYQPYDAVHWLKQMFANNGEEWETKFNQAKEALRKREEKARIEKEQTLFRVEFQKWAETFLEENFLTLYLPVRHFAAKELRQNFRKNQRFHYVEPYKLEEKLIENGAFNDTEYLTVGDFFEELTGAVQSYYEWGRHAYEYETYYDHYESLILQYVNQWIPGHLLLHLPKSLKEDYRIKVRCELTEDVLQGWVSGECLDLAIEFTHELAEEYILDLMEIVDLPFNEDVHRKMLEKAFAEREQKKAEALAEIERKKAEEARMIEDIFKEAYISSVGNHVRYVLHIGETNTGKTHQALKTMKAAQSGMYLAPLRLLALEVYDKLNDKGVPCSLKTGEEEKVMEGANHISSTVEMFHEKDFYEVVVIDEAQMLADKDRGFSWFKAITQAKAREVHIIGSRNIKDMLFSLLEGAEIELHEYTRDTPLAVEPKEFELKDTKKGDALICFSRKRVLETARKLKRTGHSVSMIYGSMPPETRKKQIKLFTSGQTQVVVATDAIGMGLNLPIRRIVFLETEKFDGTSRRRLTSQEVKQIAGRAGRKGIYDIGRVAFASEIEQMNRLLEQPDQPVETFAIAPTSYVFERFQKYYHDLGTFFDLWDQFEPPKGTKKASLDEERELYELIAGTVIESRFSMMDLYGFLHLPFSAKEPVLVRQWLDTMMAIVDGVELPDPVIKRKGLKDFELSYKTIGLHLLFLYRMGKKTEAVYWERVREEISDGVFDVLKDEIDNERRNCKKCGKALPDDSPFAICDGCYQGKLRRGNKNYYRRGFRRR